jgi:hypothetical protein
MTNEEYLRQSFEGIYKKTFKDLDNRLNEIKKHSKDQIITLNDFFYDLLEEVHNKSDIFYWEDYNTIRSRMVNYFIKYLSSTFQNFEEILKLTIKKNKQDSQLLHWEANESIIYKKKDDKITEEIRDFELISILAKSIAYKDFIMELEKNINTIESKSYAPNDLRKDKTNISHEPVVTFLVKEGVISKDIENAFIELLQPTNTNIVRINWNNKLFKLYYLLYYFYYASYLTFNEFSDSKLKNFIVSRFIHNEKPIEFRVITQSINRANENSKNKEKDEYLQRINQVFEKCGLRIPDPNSLKITN